MCLLTEIEIRSAVRGSALLEVMITIIILVVGLLGIAGLQARIHVLELESHQRGQAVVVLNDIADRLSSNRESAASYAAASPLGTGHAARATCAGSIEATDICDWDDILIGEGEKVIATGATTMQAARACITEFTSATKIFNRCQTGVQIEVAWRGRSATVVPASDCGKGSYGADDAYRRVVSTRIATGDKPC